MLSVLLCFCLFFFFFFSSRRRHTRCSRDWSSDVCSSDLVEARAAVERQHLLETWRESERAVGPVRRSRALVPCAPSRDRSDRGGGRLARRRAAHGIARGRGLAPRSGIEIGRREGGTLRRLI